MAFVFRNPPNSSEARNRAKSLYSDGRDAAEDKIWKNGKTNPARAQPTRAETIEYINK